MAFFAAAALLGIVIARWRRGYKICGLALLGLALLLAINASPFFQSPAYDQYHGPQGMAPYQALIDDVNEKGGVTFWNHMETASGMRSMPPINVSTPPYPEVLTESKGYTGFASIYGDNRSLTEPGRDWDQVLLEYCKGLREKPVWGIATADYHEEGYGSGVLGFYQTVFLLREELSSKALAAALKTGKYYASQGPYLKRPIMQEFWVEDSGSGVVAISGDELDVSGPPRIRVAVAAMDKQEHKIKVRLIRGGELIETIQAQTPFSMDYVDHNVPPAQKNYYRIDVKGGIGEIIANPIFIRPAP